MVNCTHVISFRDDEASFFSSNNRNNGEDQNVPHYDKGLPTNNIRFGGGKGGVMKLWHFVTKREGVTRSGISHILVKIKTFKFGELNF